MTICIVSLGCESCFGALELSMRRAANVVYTKSSAVFALPPITISILVP